MDTLMPTTDRPQGFTGWKWSAGNLLAKFQDTTFLTATASTVQLVGTTWVERDFLTAAS